MFVPGDSVVHRMAPSAKIAATVAFVFAVVLTPKRAMWAFGIDAAVIAGIALLAHVPLGCLVRRLVIELPFLAFAFFLPFLGQGERIDVGALSLSISGLWGAWNIVIKGTLGVAAASVLGATTTVPELLRGLDQLRVPKPVVSIAGFMIRYGDVLAHDLRTMRIARESRGYDPRWIAQVRAVATSAGTLFVRAYERGERVYIAMLSRGYSGGLPAAGAIAVPAGDWGRALLAPAAAAVIAVIAAFTT